MSPRFKTEADFARGIVASFRERGEWEVLTLEKEKAEFVQRIPIQAV